MYGVYIAIQVIGIALLFISMALLLHEDGSREQNLMVTFIGGSLIQNCAYLLELLAKSQEAAITATKMEYLGSSFIAVSYCWFMCCYCYAKVPERFFRIIMGINTVLLVLIFTCDMHTL